MAKDTVSRDTNDRSDPAPAGNEPLPRLLDAVILAPVEVDDWSDVRSLHARSLARLATAALDPDQIAAFRSLAGDPDYMRIIETEHMTAARLDGQMIATAGWAPADDSGGAARITSVFVDPLFTRLGVGSRLIRAVEEQAAGAGFAQFTARVTANAVPLFLRLGYEISSYGVFAFSDTCELPVTYLRRSALAATADPTPTAATDAVPPDRARSAALRGRAMQIGQDWPSQAEAPRANIKPRRR